MVSEIPEIGDEVCVSNTNHWLVVTLVAEESNTFFTDKFLRYNNGYQTNQFSFSSITKLIRPVEYEEIPINE